MPKPTPHAAAYAAVYDLLPVGIVETDTSLNVVRCNRAFAAMVGARPADLVGRFGGDFLHPDGGPPDLTAIADLCAGCRSAYSVNQLLLAADGSGLPVQLDWSVVCGAAGQVEVLLCSVTDVSRVARTAAQLRAVRERAETLWSRAPVGIVEVGQDGEILSANPALGEMLGHAPDKLVGTSAGRLIDPEQAPEPDAAWGGLLREGGGSDERRYVRADGTPVRVHVLAAALHDDTEEVDRVAAFVVDVSEAHAQRAALAEALDEIARARDEVVSRQQFTDALLETIDVGIASCNADGSTLFRNEAQRRLLNLTDPAVSSLSAEQAAQFVDIFDASGTRVLPRDYPLARALRGETITDTEFKIGPRGGPYRDVLIRGRRIVAPDSTVLGAVVAVADVTAERTGLRELATERERLRQAQRLAQMGSFTYDVATNSFTFSPEMYRIWGISPEEDLAALRRDMIHPDDLPEVVRHWETAVRTAGEHATGYRIVRRDGSVRHLRVSFEVELDDAGTPTTLHGTHLDVTDLTVARTEAVEANAFLNAILAATPDFTFVSDLSTGAVVYGSPRQSILGLTYRDLVDLGSGVTILVHPQDLPRLAAARAAAHDLADGEVLSLRYRARHVDGTWHWVDRRETPFRRDQVTGRVSQVLGVVRDVTDEHRTALALREQETRLRALVTRVVDYAIVGLDRAGVIEYWNDGAQRLKGYAAEDAIGRSFTMFYTEQDRAAGLPAQLLDEARERGRVESTGWRVRADGTQFWANAVLTALYDDAGSHTGFVKVTRDLTAQLRLEMAQESLFATVTHDLKTPIIAIKGFAELLGDVDAATRADYAARIARQADHVGEIVSELFDYAKLRSRTTTMPLEALPLRPLVQAVVDGVGPALNAFHVTVADSTLAAWADRPALSRILENVLTNAAKYSPPGTPISVSFAASADHVRICVTDQGRGIAPEDLDTIFDEFIRGRLAQENDGGTGLGLASVRRLATLQGGRVWLDSELGRGTTVTVELARASPPKP